MRTLHVVFSYMPDAPGGTELYVDALCRRVGRLGISCVVAAPGERDETYELDQLRIRRFAWSQGRLAELYEGSQSAAAALGRILDEEAPDLVHQHALTPACSPLVAQAAKRRGMAVVFTYHTPTATCQRGTLLEHGRTQCDGRLDVARCTACTLDGLGVGASLSKVLAATPAGAGDWLERADWQGGAWTALRMSSLIRRRHGALRRFFQDVDRFVVLAPWVEEVLRKNGVPEGKIVRSAHGVDPARASHGDRLRSLAGPIRLVHLGRADRSKGTDLLIRAFREAPEANATLDIYGVVQSVGGTVLMEDFRALAGDDSRIRFLPAVAHVDVAKTLMAYHMVVVPSQWMETGPLVVLEAFAAGVPVMGSRLGGIADKVKDGIDGVLVQPFDSVTAWRDALQRCSDDPGLADRLAQSVRTPRAMASVAEDMRQLYLSLAPISGNRVLQIATP